MKRNLKKCVAFIPAVGLSLVLAGNVFAHAHADYKGHWAEKQIEEWVHKGLVAGYDDETFLPDRVISRAEFVTLVNRVFQFTDKAEVQFSDVPADAWFEGEIAKGIAAGYISADSANSFRPNDALSRVEAAKILSVVLKWNAAEETHALHHFKDAGNVPEWAKSSLSNAVEHNYITGSSDGWIQPLKKVTRAEAITVLYQASGGTLNSAQTIPAVKAEQALEGYLIDKHCFALGEVEDATKMCLTMAKCAASGYGVAVKQPDGSYKFYLFDEKGQALAKDYLKTTTKDSDFIIQVKGAVDGEDVEVLSLSDK